MDYVLAMYWDVIAPDCCSISSVPLTRTVSKKLDRSCVMLTDPYLFGFPFDPLAPHAPVLPTGFALPGVGCDLVQYGVHLRDVARANQCKTRHCRLTRIILSPEFSRSGGDSCWGCRVLSNPFGRNRHTVYVFGLSEAVRRGCLSLWVGTHLIVEH